MLGSGEQEQVDQEACRREKHRVVNRSPLGLELRETQDGKAKGWTGVRGGHGLC